MSLESASVGCEGFDLKSDQTCTSSLLQATLAETCLTHPDLWLNRQQSSCIVGDVVTGFWRGRITCGSALIWINLICPSCIHAFKSMSFADTTKPGDHCLPRPSIRAQLCRRHLRYFEHWVDSMWFCTGCTGWLGQQMWYSSWHSLSSCYVWAVDTQMSRWQNEMILNDKNTIIIIPCGSTIKQLNIKMDM